MQSGAAKIGMRVAVRHVDHVGRKGKSRAAGVFRLGYFQCVAGDGSQPITRQGSETDFAAVSHSLDQCRAEVKAGVLRVGFDFVGREKAEGEAGVRGSHFCERLHIQPHNRMNGSMKRLVEHNVERLVDRALGAEAVAKRAQTAKETV